MKAIEQAAIMLKRTQPYIIQLHRAILKYDEIIGLLKKLDFQYNISFSGSKCLANVEAARFWTNHKSQEVTLFYKA